MSSETEEHESAAVDAKAVRRHVEALHGGYYGDAEFVVHFRKGGRPAQYTVPRDEERQLARKVSRLVGEGADAYISVCRFSPGRKPNTRKAIDAQVVPGVWADIDVKPDVPTSIHDADELDRLLDALPEPTLLVGSGSGGCHPYWLLDEPTTDTDRMEDLAPRWIKYISAVATNVLGRTIKVDSVGDLARILRLAGSRRSDGRMVELLDDDGPRYNIELLDALTTLEPEPKPKPKTSAKASARAAAGIEVAMTHTEADEFVTDGLDLDELREHGVPMDMSHDKTLSRIAYKLRGQGLSRAEAREIWGEIVDHTELKQPAWKFGEKSFARHWRGAAEKLKPAASAEAADSAAQAAEAFEDDVLAEIRDQKVRREAKRRIDEDDFAEPPEAGSLADQQEDPEPAPSCIVEDIIPRDGIVMLNAAMKSGKTTLVSVNLACDLASDLGVDRDHTPKFLGAFPVDFPEGCIGIWNLEVGAGQLQRWLFARELSAEAAARIFPMHLRGMGVDLLVPAWEAWAVGWLRGHGIKVWIIDPQSKLLRNEIDASEYNAFWKTLERIQEQAGVDLVILIHHTGNPSGDGDGMPRARGTSAMGGNADVIYTYRHGGALGELPPPGDTRRYFGGFGRDIAFPEITLDYDADSGRLTVAADSQGRAADKALREARRAYEVVKAHHDDTGEPMNATDAKAAIGGKPATAVRALARCVREGWLTVAAGPRNSKLYTPKPGEIIL